MDENICDVCKCIAMYVHGNVCVKHKNENKTCAYVYTCVLLFCP